MTDVERTCLQLVARGETFEALPSQFGNDMAVNELLASARRKLMANTTMEAVARALNLGLIE
ncbi:MAG: hypothetical protein KUA43_23330 [Hoeflea sp.]|uniref:hypothetical protein n=1 Tax=Hoeflea sp. TaxID=1940281 RepID=UPI001D2F481D|nr:hypothetical protein [Hoeflea sp.]MBU4530785.1 hypothetical protein [Alphaproteobacteria bacterium]MBU4544784.1 hypothetical protein [Alphaproteobacteria bacterium]MBU4549340.1 hypothetical protein [Alphaproteobacteria bacterium]MBV1726379.1 hypothetical protein [Hoeflea sp.]MBV1761721.1 hypothetical protein [Hoeflea sp.]